MADRLLADEPERAAQRAVSPDLRARFFSGLITQTKNNNA